MEDDNKDNNQEKDDYTQAPKKAKLFCAKEFRKQLLSTEKLTALQQFLELSNENDKYIFEYFENGGNCLELFQLLEVSTEVPASLTLEIIKNVLLQIISNYPQFHSSAYEACRYFLNTHITFVNKMLSLASTGKERKALLKLLTVIVTFSRNLAKDILLHVVFNPTNLEMLTKHVDTKDSVRSAFIQYLISFLVEGEYPIISILLEKKGLLTSIINGLQYDSSEIVCMVMTTFKTNILENPYVSKTAKMSIFSTPVIKDIVNLYNWKGLDGFNAKKKRQTIVVDEYEKSQVNEAVHEFLLVLCTSHKFGVIFKDRQLGLGKKQHNSLMYTVLESLERPWEHSYAGELVTKICGACPDLVKTMWANLKDFLQPRPTVRWLAAVKYAVRLVQQLDPSGIEFCVKELNVQQLIQIIQILVAPTPIIKAIIPESKTFEEPIIKHYILIVLVEFLKSIKKFIISAENWLTASNYRILKNTLREHISRNFLDVLNVLQDWSKSDDNAVEPYSVSNHLQVIFQLFDLYESMCPHLLENLSTISLQSLLNEIQNLPDKESSTSLQIRAVKLFVTFEPSIFTPKNEPFSTTLPLLLETYSNTKDLNARATLNLLLKNSGIFEGCLEEIDIWVDAILNLNSYDANTGSIIVQIITQTSQNLFEYLTEMAKFSEDSETKTEHQNILDMLENLYDDSMENSCNAIFVKHQNLSPLLLGAFKCLQNGKDSKNFKSYFNCVLVNLLHSQTSPVLIANIILNENHRKLISKHVLNYVESWCCNLNPVNLLKTKMNLVEDFSLEYLESDVNKFFEKHGEKIDSHPGVTQGLLNQALFYFCNLSTDKLTKTHLDNCEKVIKHLLKKEIAEELIKKIFGHPILLRHFSPFRLNKANSQGLSTVFLMNIVKEFQSLNLQKELDNYLKPFRVKLVSSLKRVLKKKKSLNTVDILEVLETFKLEHQHCIDILNFCSELSFDNLESEYLSFYYNIVVYSLKTHLQEATDNQPLNDQIISCVIKMLTFLNGKEQSETSSCANALKVYIETFPKSLQVVEPSLFESILKKNEFCKENSFLANLLLTERKDFIDIFIENLSNISNKKGLMLSLLQATINIKPNKDILERAYQSFEPSILKSLHKPQKAGQYFEMYHGILPTLIKEFLSKDICKCFVEKVHKFEVGEPFHVEMLITIFNKSLFDEKEDIQENFVNNVILTLIHIINSVFKRKTKLDGDEVKLNKIIKYTINFFELNFINERDLQISFRSLCENDNFQTCCKLCLKFGLSGNESLIKLLKCFLKFVDFKENESELLLEMVGSHSEFLNVILGEQNECKLELLHLILVLCQRWPSLMQRNHVPVLLAAYNATVKPTDRTILTLLQSYEQASNKTNFYDFQPILWGTAAAAHYSVRRDIQSSLWRQPKMGDILDILKKEFIYNTIVNYPLDSGLTVTESTFELQNENVYDLTFFLPLFSSLLAPENETATLKFVKSGALSLTVVALSSNNTELRMSACHVLNRLYYHVEAKSGGKDKLLWLRFIEGLCKGTGVLEDFKLNSFAAIFWAKMALILTQPLHPLYVPMSQYLGAKLFPNLNGIPELYTFLHSSDVNFKDTRMFILEILRDGLRRDSDFLVALHSMAFKLIMELFSSCVADLETKSLILNVLEKACNLNMGRYLLCSSYGLLSWLYQAVMVEFSNKNLISVVIKILKNILKSQNDSKFKIDNSILKLIIEYIKCHGESLDIDFDIQHIT